MLQTAKREEKDKGLQNLKYSNEFLNFLVILGSISLKTLDLFRQNLTGMTIYSIRHHRSPVVAMTDCTILKAGLQYSTNLGCIVGSTLNRDDCKIKTYDDIYNKTFNIKQENAIAKYVRIYVLQVPLPKFPPVIVILIPTKNDNAKEIFALHEKLIEIAADLELHIISIGSNGATSEF
ncbi:hypothetical protein C1646_768565 [Rhizophagus diaphanus]|nr:hypothetical protein C1646_768565 [Rhizophagus diaphanus] [Rhizophagus sp. MUCL 43196]